ncbi:MAG TPA: DUF6069 family protein [Acidimicrobiales bacterium]|jgi:hypothetical protein
MSTSPQRQLERPAWLRDTGLEPLLDRFQVDFRPNQAQPSWARLAVATVVSIVGSLVADALLVAIGTKVFPSTKGFVHFQFSDYAKLTTIGVIFACAAWPIVTRISSKPRRLFFWLAIAVTGALLLPDLWILLRGEPADAVLVLVAMHLAIAVVTYNALVRLAPAARTGPPDTDRG